MNSVKNDFVNPFKTALGNVEQWVYNDFILKIGTFFDTTLPRYFRTAGPRTSGSRGVIEGIFKTPVNWGLQHVIDPLDSGINAVAGFVGLHPNLPTTLALAAGGKITQGSGPTADNVLARVPRGDCRVRCAFGDAGPAVRRGPASPGTPRVARRCPAVTAAAHPATPPAASSARCSPGRGTSRKSWSRWHPGTAPRR